LSCQVSPSLPLTKAKGAQALAPASVVAPSPKPRGISAAWEDGKLSDSSAEQPHHAPIDPGGALMALNFD